MYCFITLLRIIGCLMILNFHMDMMYPDALKLFAFGGDLGNNLFFIISGYCLVGSIKDSNVEDFIKWYRKRLSRIIPMLWFFTVCLIVADILTIDTIGALLKAFVFPTKFWYIGALIILYPLLFWVEKITDKKLIFFLRIGLLLSCFIFPSVISERYLIGFMSMMIGAELAGYENKNISWWILASCLIVYIGLKLIKKNLHFGTVTWITVHVLCSISILFICSVFLILFSKREAVIACFFKKHKKLYLCANLIGESTLACYLLQCFADRKILFIVGDYLSYPVNIIIGTAICLGGAIVLTIIGKYMRIIYLKIHKK